MNPKELLKQFKNSPWRNEQDIASFLLAIDTPVDPRTVTQLLDVLLNKRLASDAGAHGMRIRVFSKIASEVDDKRLFAHYVRALKDGDAAVRSSVIPLFSKVNNYEDHPKLCGLLKSKSLEVRQATVRALKEVGGKTVLQAIGKMAGDKDFTGRGEAIDLVMPMAGHHAIGILQATLSLGNQNEKIKALKYLGDAKYMARARSVALRTMVPVLEEKDEQVVVQAIKSFSAIAGEEAYFEYIEPFLESDKQNIVQPAISALGNYSSPRVMTCLERKLRSGPNAVRVEVLNALYKIGNEEVLPLLVEALGHKQLPIRTQAGEVLSKLSQQGKLDTARVIIWLLHSRDVNVRRMAVEIARKVKDPAGELWPKLLAFLRDEDWWVRERVKDALVEMAGKQLTPHMVGLLQDPYDVVRRFAIDVLVQIRDADALGAIVTSAREDTDWWTREKAIEAMGTLNDERAIPYIVDIMRKDEDIQFVCIEALMALKAASAAPYVAELLVSKNIDVRCLALKCLGDFHATEYASEVQPMLADPSSQVVQQARELLLHWNMKLSEKYTESHNAAVSFLDKMLITVVDGEGDDLILASGRKPHMKRMGQVKPISNAVLSHEQIRALITPHLSVAQVTDLGVLADIDFSYEIKEKGARFRVNVFQQQGGLGAVFRTIKGDLPELDSLGLPEVVKQFGDLKHGLVLVGGPTGSGKSTTLAALIDYINRVYDKHVISLEDPIEVIHNSKKGLVNQREVGTHTRAFSTALRSTLREDPDVILVGEMRDLVTISFAVTAAETGHLVFGTVHTVSVDTTVDRIINTFPAPEQPQVRSSLAENLRAVVCQHLLKRADASGRVLAAEVMINTDAVSNLIHKGKTYQIPSMIATSGERGMQLMDNELMRLYKQKLISAEDAYMKAVNKKEFESVVGEEVKEKALEGDVAGGESQELRESDSGENTR
jgi:twitching motility protein PilT